MTAYRFIVEYDNGEWELCWAESHHEVEADLSGNGWNLVDAPRAIPGDDPVAAVNQFRELELTVREHNRKLEEDLAARRNGNGRPPT